MLFHDFIIIENYFEWAPYHQNKRKIRGSTKDQTVPVHCKTLSPNKSYRSLHKLKKLSSYKSLIRRINILPLSSQSSLNQLGVKKPLGSLLSLQILTSPLHLGKSLLNHWQTFIKPRMWLRTRVRVYTAQTARISTSLERAGVIVAVVPVHRNSLQ